MPKKHKRKLQIGGVNENKIDAPAPTHLNIQVDNKKSIINPDAPNIAALEQQVREMPTLRLPMTYYGNDPLYANYGDGRPTRESSTRLKLRNRNY